MTQYPEWQQAIREAQAEDRAVRAQLDNERQERALNEAREHGRNLGRVLSMFGIDAFPDVNEFKLDGFRFSLDTRGNYDRGTTTFTESVPRGSDKLSLWFTLYISKALTDEETASEAFDGFWREISDDITVKAQPIDGDWSRIRANMANILDTIQENYERIKGMRRTVPVTPVVSVPTPAEKLLAALDEMIAARIEQRFSENTY